ncbi:hypothetical protein ACIPF8_17440 [Collimonas sp. NPDC087041]|uniref:hypothetical protein n=1 Tax=Collimonas sp. NPDC087041 TaxID=3363960 RepID=UPI0038066ECB
MAEIKPHGRANALMRTEYMVERRRSICLGMRAAAALDPDFYMAYLIANHDDLGADFVARQLEWAEQILQDQMAGVLPGALRPAAPVNSLPHGEAGGSGPTESVARIRAYWE